MSADKDTKVRPEAGETHLKAALRRMRRDKAALTGTVIILFLGVMALAAPIATPYDPFKQDFEVMLEAPSLAHPLGTDRYGRDVLTRIIYGCRYALIIGVAVVAIQLLVGMKLLSHLLSP